MSGHDARDPSAPGFWGDVTWRVLQVGSGNLFLLLVFLGCARALGAYDFGVYNYVLALLSLGVVFSGFGAGTSVGMHVARYAATAPERIAAALSSGGLAVLAATALTTLALLAFGPAYLGARWPYVLLALPLLLLDPLVAVLDNLYRGLRRFRELSLCTAAAAALALGLAYVLTLRFRLAGAILAHTAYFLPLLALLAARLRRSWRRYDGAVLREVGRYAAVVWMVDVAYFFYGKVDVLFLGHFGLFPQIGSYELANKLLHLLALPSLIVGQVLAPRTTRAFAQGRYEELRQMFKRTLLLSAAWAALVVALVYLLQGAAVSFLPAGYDRGEVLRVVTLMSVVYFSQVTNGVVPTGFILATGHARICVYCLTAFSLLNVVLDYVLLQRYGFFGVVYATLLVKPGTDLVSLVLYGRLLWRLR